MDKDPETKTAQPYKTSDKTSFAHQSVTKRWPVIVTGAIDDVHRTTGKATDEETIKEGKAIVADLAKLKYEMQHDRQLSPLPEDGNNDIHAYNLELNKRGPPSWLDVSWLFSECYLYRRIATLFALSTKWKNYDIFSRQKLSTFKSSRAAVIELSARYKELVTQLEGRQGASEDHEESRRAEELLFTEMCEVCLWGNATDLSLLTNITYEDIQKLQGSKARKAAEANILANDLPQAFAALKKAQAQNASGERRVDFILDNAGFELFVDLVLAGYLLASGLATTIVLHPKSIPWFVSDVIPADFSALLNALADPQAFYTAPDPEKPEDDDSDGRNNQPLSAAEVADLNYLFEHWSTLHAEGKLVIRPSRFWTRAGSYWRLPSESPELYADLQESELVIFKGDLNYRKLTGDVSWPATTPFEEAIGPLVKAPAGLRVLALRTCKADVVVGLAQGQDEKLRAAEGGGGETGARKWAWSGKWAVVQFNDGRPQP